MASDSEQTITDFVERMGTLIQADGLPRIAGRIMGLMVIYGGPFSFSELVERLQVSRASVSTNSRLLERLGVIERTNMPGERQDYFKLRPQPYARMLRGYVERMHHARDVVWETQEALPPDYPDAHARLRELDAFYEALSESFLTVIENCEAGGKISPLNKPKRTARQSS